MANDQNLIQHELKGIQASALELYNRSTEINNILQIMLDGNQPIVQLDIIEEQHEQVLHLCFADFDEIEQSERSLNKFREITRDYALAVSQQEMNCAKDFVTAYVFTCLESWKDSMNRRRADIELVLPSIVNRLAWTEYMQQIHFLTGTMVTTLPDEINKFRIRRADHILCLRKTGISNETQYDKSMNDVFKNCAVGQPLNWRKLATILMILANTIYCLIKNVGDVAAAEKVAELIRVVAVQLVPRLSRSSFTGDLNRTMNYFYRDEPSRGDLQHPLTSEEIDKLHQLVPCEADGFRGVSKKSNA